MSESILVSIKKLLGIDESYTPFDADILMHINTVMMILNQMGIGPADPFIVEDEQATWADFLEEKDDIIAVKTFIALKVRLLFDPPASSSHITAIETNLKELEWRLYTAQSSGNFKVTKPTIIWEEEVDDLDE